MSSGKNASQTVLDGVVALERATGISAATLRVWERRYGFPHPQRDARGHRTYDGLQAAKLRLIAQLMARGERPGQLVGQSIKELQARVAEPVASGPANAHDTLLDMLRALDLAGVLQFLLQQLTARGLDRFVGEVVASTNAAVGTAVAQGLLQAREEHLYTECVQQVLRSAILATPAAPAAARPRVVLATPQGEYHGLGLLMAHAVLALRHCAVLPLGHSLPADQIAAAASAWKADVVALSMTDTVPQRTLVAFLRELRALLPARVACWGGGSSRAIRRQDVSGALGLRVFDNVSEVAGAVDELRAAMLPGRAR